MNNNDRHFFIEAWRARKKLNEISRFLFGHHVTVSCGAFDDIDTHIWNMAQYYLLTLVAGGDVRGDDEINTIAEAFSAETEEKMLSVISNYISMKNKKCED